VILIGRKKNPKVELTDLKELRKRVKEIKKRREKMYKRFTIQSNKRR
jgi:tRNA(Ser,Leu) C12 N-acetylase TAN1